MARLGVYFASKWLGPFYDLTTDEEANDCVCVLKALACTFIGVGGVRPRDSAWPGLAFTSLLSG